jgi:hypothetical protein
MRQPLYIWWRFYIFGCEQDNSCQVFRERQNMSWFRQMLFWVWPNYKNINRPNNKVAFNGKCN